MFDASPIVDLRGKRGLIIGIADERSIATGCASAFRRAGARLGATYLDDGAEPDVRPIVQRLECEFLLPCDVRDEDQLDTLFDWISTDWGRLDFVLHSVAFAPKDDWHGRVVDCSTGGFIAAMNVSCHSFLRIARRAEPLMAEGGCLLAMTFQGSNRVVPNYNLMGPVKAALESCVRYAAAELGPRDIRVHAISPGPIPTRTGAAIEHFDELLDKARKTPERRRAGTEDVGNLAAFLVSDAARCITGTVIPVDSGAHLLA